MIFYSLEVPFNTSKLSPCDLKYLDSGRAYSSVVVGPLRFTCSVRDNEDDAIFAAKVGGLYWSVSEAL